MNPKVSSPVSYDKSKIKDTWINQSNDHFLFLVKVIQARSFDSEEEEEDDIFEDDRKVQFRSNFPETWLFGDVVIGLVSMFLTPVYFCN